MHRLLTIVLILVQWQRLLVKFLRSHRFTKLLTTCRRIVHQADNFVVLLLCTSVLYMWVWRRRLAIAVCGNCTGCARSMYDLLADHVGTQTRLLETAWAAWGASCDIMIVVTKRFDEAWTCIVVVVPWIGRCHAHQHCCRLLLMVKVVWGLSVCSRAIATDDCNRFWSGFLGLGRCCQVGCTSVDSGRLNAQMLSIEGCHRVYLTHFYSLSDMPLSGLHGLTGLRDRPCVIRSWGSMLAFNDIFRHCSTISLLFL